MTTQKYTLQQARQILGLKMRDLANLTGLSTSTIHRIERAKDGQAVNLHTVALLCESLGMEPEELIWPFGITEDGRKPLTGGSYTITRKFELSFTETIIVLCPRHFTELPVTGICDRCE